MSLFGKINWLDVLKGFIVAVGTVVLTGVYTALQSGTLPTLAQLETLGLAGLGAGLAYLLKNIFSNNAGVPLAKDVPASTTVGELTNKV
jgi:hypothetical protein